MSLHTSKTVLAQLVDLFSPNFRYSFDIMWFILYFGFFASITLLDDLFFCSLLYTLVSGLLYIFFIRSCFLVLIFLETFVFAGLFFVECCQIGMVWIEYTCIRYDVGPSHSYHQSFLAFALSLSIDEVRNVLINSSSLYFL